MKGSDLGTRPGQRGAWGTYGMLRLRDVRSWLLGIGLFGTLGCWSSPSRPTAPAQPYRGVKLVAGVVGDPTILRTLASQRGEWAATNGAEVSIRDEAIDPKATEGVDVVLFRGDRLGELVDTGALVVLPESLTRPPAPSQEESAHHSSAEREDEAGRTSETPPSDPLQFADVVPALREQASRYGRDRLALPIGGTALVLVYHRAAFEREPNQTAAREAKVDLAPPKTWTEFDALAKFFQARDWDGDGAQDHGVALALGPDPEGLGDATFLTRAVSLGQHRDQYSFLFNADSMAPRIDSPPFVEALEGMTALKACGPPGIEGFDAEAARRAFAQGKAAMLIDRAERFASWGDRKAIGVAELPGSERVFDPANARWEPATPPNRPSYLPDGGGWLVGVAASSRSREAAMDFARYLLTPEISNRIRADRSFPMLAVRSAQLDGPPDPAAAPGVDTRQWSEAVRGTLLAARVVPGLRIPEAEGYLADLAKGRVAAIQGEPAAAALRAVAKAWTERSARLGVARQLWHYRRSLNSLATLPQPPPR